MNKFFLLLTAFVVSSLTTVYAQSFSASYTYDANGNRITAQIIYLTLKSASIGNEAMTQSDIKSDSTLNYSISLFPNPVVNEVQIEFKGYTPNDFTQVNSSIEIYDTNGNSISKIYPIEISNSFDFAPYPQGIYLVRITISGKTNTYKIIKK